LALAVGSRWDSDYRRRQMPGVGAIVCGYGGIIRVRCQMRHPQRWGRGCRDGWFGRSRSRQEGHAVSHPQRIGKCRGSRDGGRHERHEISCLQRIGRCMGGRDRGCPNFGSRFVWGDFIHPQRCGRDVAG